MARPFIREFIYRDDAALPSSLLHRIKQNLLATIRTTQWECQVNYGSIILA